MAPNVPRVHFRNIRIRWRCQKVKPLATSAPVDVVPDHHATCYPAKCVSTLPQRVSRSSSFELPLLIYMLACTASASDHANAREHAAVFSVQHLFLFHWREHNLDSHF